MNPIPKSNSHRTYQPYGCYADCHHFCLSVITSSPLLQCTRSIASGRLHSTTLHYRLSLLRTAFTFIAAGQYIPRHLVLVRFWLSLFLKNPKHIHRPTRFKNTASQSHQHMLAPGTSYLSVHHPRSTRRRRASASALVQPAALIAQVRNDNVSLNSNGN